MRCKPSRTLPAFGLALIAAAATLAPAAQAQDINELNPSDLIARYFSQAAFARLDANQLYDVSIAVKRGRSIQIEGCSMSQSRTIIMTAAQDRAQGLRMVETTCNR